MFVFSKILSPFIDVQTRIKKTRTPIITMNPKIKILKLIRIKNLEAKRKRKTTKRRKRRKIKRKKKPKRKRKKKSRRNQKLFRLRNHCNSNLGLWIWMISPKSSSIYQKKN